MGAFEGRVIGMVILLFFLPDISGSAGLNVCICKKDGKIAESDVLISNFSKDKEGSDFILFGSPGGEIGLKIKSSPGMEYYLNFLKVECAEEKPEMVALDPSGKVMRLLKKKEIYTALDSNGDMVGELLKQEDSRLWPQKKGFLKKIGSRKEWVNIDFSKDEVASHDYLLIAYKGTENLGREILRANRVKNRKDIMDGEKTKEKLEVLKDEDFTLKIKQWNGDRWVNLEELKPYGNYTKRVLLKRHQGLTAGKFRAELSSGMWSVDAVMLASGEKIKRRRAQLHELPESARFNDSEYFKMDSAEALNTEFKMKKGGVCVIELRGYYNLKHEKKDYPTGIDDVINRFLSRIKFWS